MITNILNRCKININKGTENTHSNNPSLLFAKHFLPMNDKILHLKPLSQLAHEHFTTLCNRKLLAWYERLHRLYDAHSHAFQSSHKVSSKRWACKPFSRDRMRSKLSECNARTSVRTSCSILCTRKSDARFFKVVR